MASRNSTMTMSHEGIVHTVRTTASRAGSHTPLCTTDEVSGFAGIYAANSRVLADVTDLGAQPPSYERKPPAPAATARTPTSTHATHARQLRLDSPRREDNLCHIDHPARQLHARQIHSPGPLTTVHFWRNAYYYYEEVSVGVEANEGAIDVVRGFLVRSSGRTDSLNSSPPEHDAACGAGAVSCSAAG